MLLVEVFQGTICPAFGAVALVHLVVVIIETCRRLGRLLAIFAWAQALQNWDQLVALNHVHDILGLHFSGWILDDLVGLEFESYSAPIVHRVLELDLEGHRTAFTGRRFTPIAVAWLNGIGNGQESRTFNLCAFGALSKDCAAARSAAATIATIWLRRDGNGIAELERGGVRL